MSLTSFIVRYMFTKADDKRDAGLTTPDDIQRFDDIVYGPDPKWNRLDVYRPKNTQGKLPVIVSVHGGGWVYGDKERYQYYCMDLAQRGFAVVNFTYHLSPKFKFPQPLLETCLVFRWVLDNAESYGLDTDNLFAVGDSAGGHLLSLYCAVCTNPAYAARYSFSAPAGGCPKAVGLNSGAFQFTADNSMTKSLMKDFLPQRGTPEEYEQVTPLHYLNGDFPPSYIMTAPKDFLKDDALKMHQALDTLGVENIYRMYDNEDHSLAHVFHLDIRSAAAKECNDEECRFFRNHMN